MKYKHLKNIRNIVDVMTYEEKVKKIDDICRKDKRNLLADECHIDDFIINNYFENEMPTEEILKPKSSYQRSISTVNKNNVGVLNKIFLFISG